jgi:hypothetical protein
VVTAGADAKYSREANGEIHSFHAGDYSHPRATEIFALLDLLSPTSVGVEVDKIFFKKCPFLP